LIQNLLKNDPDFHQDDDEKGILDLVPFDTGLEQARMTREIHCYIVNRHSELDSESSEE